VLKEGGGCDILEFDRELTYEEKIWLIDVIRKRLERLETKINMHRVNVEKKCPHRKTFNVTTLADPVNVEKRLCTRCNTTLVYKDGILIKTEE